MFAQPFVGQLGNGHRDGVYSIAKNMKTVGKIATGSGDGVVKYWDVGSKEELHSFKAHYGMCSGLVVVPGTSRDGGDGDGDEGEDGKKKVRATGKLLSCGAQKTIKLWNVNDQKNNYGQNLAVTSGETVMEEGLMKTYLSEHALQSMDHHRDQPMFVTGGAQIELWDTNRTRPVSNLSWGADNITTVKFNMTETSVLASAGSDNSLILYDIRTNSPTQKIRTTMRNNAICWNPMEAYVFATANEDHNAYLWDMRNMSRSINVFKDHVSAVMDVDFSPTGQEIVTGSYDKTIRLYGYRQGHSRDIYHTKRMQHVFITKFSMDSKYVFSGSDEGNVRVWRSKASERSGAKSTKLRMKLEYDEKLKERYAYMPEIKRISRHRHLPIAVKKAGEIKRIEIESLKKREENRRRHSKKSDVKYVSEREKPVVGQVHKK
ncbi:unnamed protein product [Ambrosiozyma monospora]|uniref:Unnamed protein product n=1 Tax=Ambrosiozyma monospora TaxID=43982 RepID=A0ACB5TV92_AMBMO|nr:unnamed protein product [Ambrosiozyma monospora]